MSLADQLRDDPPRQWKRRPELLCCAPLPLPMHGLNPRTILGHQWWDAVRFAAYRSTDYHCAACGIARFAEEWCQWLEGHEVYEVDHLLGKMTYVETVPLCCRCHAFIHSGYLRVQLEEGIISRAEYQRTMTHGASILKAAGLRKPEPYTGPTVEWSEWRLVIGEVEYPPLYASFEVYARERGK